MPNPVTLHERRLRMTKAQLIDEIDTLEQRAAAIEATYVSTQTDVTDLALADYDAAIRLDPSHQKAYLDRGNIRYQRGFYSDAIRDYMNALGLWLGLS